MNTIQIPILPYEIQDLIWRHYFNIYVLTAIREKRNARFNKLKEYIQLNTKDIDLYDINYDNLLNLTDFEDYSALHNERNLNIENIQNNYYPMSSIFQSIQNGLEAFYSLSLTDREKLRTKAREFQFQNKFGSGLFGHNPETEFFSHEYSNIIDDNRKSGCHSGFSFGYCLREIVYLIMNNKDEKEKLWMSHIVNYYITYL
jgi:hypothetical protein